MYIMCILPLPLLFLWLHLAAARASDCAQLSSDGETVYTCSVADGVFKLEASENDYANIRCQKGSISCATMPFFSIANEDALNSLSLYDCSLPSPLTCVTSRLHAKGVKSLLLDDVKDELTAEHLHGLQDLEVVMLFNAKAQRRVPFDALPDLPNLKDLRIQQGNISLAPAPSSLDHSNLLNLELAMCKIHHIPPGAFRMLGNLEELCVSGNKIWKINGTAFEGLSKLRVLDLSQNPLEELTPDVFSSTPLLEDIRLQVTHLRKVHELTFQDLNHLKKITISNGKVPLKFEDRALANISALKFLMVIDNKLASLPPSLIAGSISLTELNITGCQVAYIPPSFFSDQHQLEKLSLQGNIIQALDNTVFWPLKNLKELDLRNNEIEDLPKRIFSGLNHLVSIRMDNNQLKTIAADAFHGPRGLKILTLSHNHLTLQKISQEINNSPFQDLMQLQVLDLSFNKITVIFDDWRTRLIHKMRNINLSSNRITHLREKDTQFFARNVTVDLSQNNITRIDISENITNYQGPTFILNDNPFVCDCNLYPFLEYISRHTQPNFVIDSASCQPNKDNTTLKTKKLSELFCHVTPCPESCTCKSFPYYSSVELKCTKLPLTFFKPEIYNLTNTKLKLHTLDEPLILPSHVTSLNLSSIGLTNIPVIPDTLKEVDLSFNNIRSITEDILKSKASLYLEGNRLYCDCDNRYLLKELLLHKNRIKDIDNVKCYDDEALLTKDVAHLCDVWLASAIGGSLAALGLILVFIALLIYYNAKVIRKYLYLQGCTKFVYEEEIDGKDYDIFLSYSDNDEKLIAQQMLPKLESEGFKVCVRYRDWEIGAWIPDKIADTVKKSRRIVVVLSQSYLNSLSVLELEASKSIQSAEKMQRIIIVYIEDIKLEEIKVDPKVEDLLTSHKKTMWADTEQFWKKIKRKLPKRREDRLGGLSQGALNVVLSTEGKVQFEYKKT